MDDYEKIGIEAAVEGPASVIVRLPMVFGPGDRQDRFAWITKPMQAGREVIEMPRAWLDWTTTYGHVTDVGHAIALCATHPSAAGKIFNCGEAPVSHRV